MANNITALRSDYPFFAQCTDNRVLTSYDWLEQKILEAVHLDYNQGMAREYRINQCRIRFHYFAANNANDPKRERSRLILENGLQKTEELRKACDLGRSADELLGLVKWHDTLLSRQLRGCFNEANRAKETSQPKEFETKQFNEILFE